MPNALIIYLQPKIILIIISIQLQIYRKTLYYVSVRETSRLKLFRKIIVVHCDIKTNALSVKQSFVSKQVVHIVTTALEIINDRKHSMPETCLQMPLMLQCQIQDRFQMPQNGTVDFSAFWSSQVQTSSDRSVFLPLAVILSPRLINESLSNDICNWRQEYNIPGFSSRQR